MAIIAQLSDIHIAAGRDGVVDDGSGPVRGLRAAVTSLLGLAARPDCVVLTGDLTDNGLPAEYARLVALLSPLPMPIYPMAGNHDDRAALRAAFGAVPHLTGAGDEKEPVQYAVEVAGVRLVCCDTTVPGESYGLLDPGRLEWLDATLAACPDRPTVLATHHPPYALGVRFIDEMGMRGAPSFAAVVGRHPQIVRVISGHVHRASVGSLAGKVSVTCASTYQQLFLDLTRPGRAAMTGEPAGYAVHMIDSGEAVTHFAPTGSYRALMDLD